MLPAWRPCLSLSSSPWLQQWWRCLSDRLPLPREQRCHQGAARAPPHLVPFEANRYIMRLLVLSSLCPLLHKSSISADALSSCSAACLSACLRPILFHLCQFRMRWGSFTCSIKERFVYRSDVTVHYGKSMIKLLRKAQWTWHPREDRGSRGR